MNKLLMTGLSLLLASVVFADASIETKNKQNTFLLKAPGTLTGMKKETKVSEKAVQPTPLPVPTQQQVMPYRYVGENTRFRQFGQESGQNNPWSEENNPPYPRYSVPMTVPPMSNPWQIGGMPPQHNFESSGTDPYSVNPSSLYGSQEYFGNSHLYPDFPDDIYRDTNPAAFTSPLQNGFLPGGGGDSFGFPFSPFGMF